MRRKKKKRKFSTSLKRLFLLWLVLVFINVYMYITSEEFLSSIGQALLVKNEYEKADVIVVFGGGERTERVDHALYLYKQKYAEQIFLSGGIGRSLTTVPWAVRMQQYAEKHVPRERIYIDAEAESTFDNAKHTIDLMKKNNWKKAIIVTSPYHMRRSIWILKQLSKSESIDLKWIPNATTNSSVSSKSWWKDKWTRKVVVEEYAKYFLYRVRYILT